MFFVWARLIPLSTQRTTMLKHFCLSWQRQNDGQDKICHIWNSISDNILKTKSLLDSTKGSQFGWYHSLSYTPQSKFWRNETVTLGSIVLEYRSRAFLKADEIIFAFSIRSHRAKMFTEASSSRGDLKTSKHTQNFFNDFVARSRSRYPVQCFSSQKITWLTWDCDQMCRLFVRYLAINNNENWRKNCPNRF